MYKYCNTVNITVSSAFIYHKYTISLLSCHVSSEYQRDDIQTLIVRIFKIKRKLKQLCSCFIVKVFRWFTFFINDDFFLQICKDFILSEWIKRKVLYKFKQNVQRYFEFLVVFQQNSADPQSLSSAKKKVCILINFFTMINAVNIL